MLLAISPNTKAPILVARADLKNWSRSNNYNCTTPFYVQLVPDERGRKWSWPPAIEPWLYGMPYNLMYHRPPFNEVQAKYGAEDRLEKDGVMRAQSPSLVRIDPNGTFAQCRK